MKVILASGSPRRKELLSKIGVEFTVLVKEVDESFPDELDSSEVAAHIAKQKANAFSPIDNELVITADTVVVNEGGVLGKPKDKEHALKMLMSLSGKTHQVYTAVCLKSKKAENVFTVKTDVTFCSFTKEEVVYYVAKYEPFDKAGAYGIQEWFGMAMVQSISGCYYNVVGLPISRLYEALRTVGVVAV